MPFEVLGRMGELNAGPGAVEVELAVGELATPPGSVGQVRADLGVLDRPTASAKDPAPLPWYPPKDEVPPVP